LPESPFMKTAYTTLQAALLQTGRYETPPEARPARIAKRSAWLGLRCAKVVCLDSIGRCASSRIFGKFNHEAWAKICMASVNFAEGLGATVTFEGFEDRAAYKGPVVYVSNHMSTMETIIYPASLNAFDKLAIILKKSLTEIPLIGKTAIVLGCIPVTRKNAREDLVTVLEEGAKRLHSGMSVLMFPQGTRQSVFEARRFNSLGAKLAERSGVPLVAIAAQTDFLENGKLIKDFGPVDPTKPVRFKASPLFMPALGSKKMHEQSVAFIEGQLKAWGLPVAQESPSKSS
jgi:1-acyl-sn-glycerol-3-phosphate acyltransferase